ncbi:(Fe-S)-binding protein [Methanolapillus ohkumae]|uniref:Iron-sulfur-binding oxidoreductase FadF n=1 Tax=Methanolapillus ohkumae TaxID=3028298 RepID=A0AA96VJA3_9EURY|nr:putative iron-sulfur-binding oxidoreductase FadF [Methanosarcinaceae archaeon Am2]
MDFLSEHKKNCDQCGLCISVCPSYGDLGILSDLYGYLSESPKSESEPVSLPKNPDHDIRLCYTCNVCTVTCPQDLGIRKLISLAREKKTKEFGISDEQRLADPFSDNNMYKKIGEWEKPVVFKNEGKACDVIYFPGCAASCMNKVVGKSTAKVLDAAGVHYSVMSGIDYCCGSVAFGAGNKEPLLKIGQKNIDEITRRGAKILVTTCPGCYRAFKIIYPSLFGELGFEVLQTSEYFLRLIQEGKLTFKRDMTQYLKKSTPLILYYQDPCHLTRAAGIYNDPRRALQAVPHVSVANPSPQDSICCGFGGGVRTVFPQKSLSQAAKIHGAAENSNSDVIITNCGGCMKNIIESGYNSKSRLLVYDLAEFLSLACGNPPTERDDQKLIRLSNTALIHCLSNYDFNPYDG